MLCLLIINELAFVLLILIYSKILYYILMEVFMIIMLSIIGVLLLVANVYLLSYYSHPDDGGFGADLFAKGVMILGMTLTWSVVLFFPLDVSNSRGGTDVGFRMDILWMVIYLTIAAFVLILIPGCIYWYEADSDWGCVS